MGYQIKAATSAGAKFVEAAEAHVDAFRARAADADAQNAVCIDNFKDLQRSGVAAAFIPEALGGFGLTSVHDWMAGIATLGRGDGSTAIAINMHLAVTRGMALGFAAAKAQGSAGAEAIAAQLEKVVAGETLICATATERGTDNLHPLTEAVAVDGGYHINGTKLFVTASPIATHIAMNLRVRKDGADSIGSVMMPLDTPGITPNDDWDALGMRSSGSQSVTFADCFVPEHAIGVLAPWGRWSVPMLMSRSFSNMPLVAAFLGIAESAAELALSALSTQTKLGKPTRERPGIQHTVAEMEIDLATCQSFVDRAGARFDDFLARHAGTPPTLADAHELMKDYQSAKWVVNAKAIEIVSKAMDLAGGAGYVTGNSLTRLYRDVRAGPFMQPGVPTEARDYIGKVVLGDYPED
jgi:alkylation response protein AidB-like acyl-CoA dehydrogenase